MMITLPVGKLQNRDNSVASLRDHSAMKTLNSLTQTTAFDSARRNRAAALLTAALLLLVRDCPGQAETAPAAAAPPSPSPAIAGTPAAPHAPSAANPGQPASTAPIPDVPLTRRVPGPPPVALAAPTPAPPLLPRNANHAPRFGELLIAEETGNDPAAAAERYRAAVAQFDAQRADAAQAVFRLGESLRKLGRAEEALVQYARILREFVDQPDLVKLSQKRLSETSSMAVSANAPSAANQRVDDLLAKEMAIVREQIATTEAQIANGVQSSADVLPLRRELLRLEQERANRAEQRATNSFVSPIDHTARVINSQQDDLRGLDADVRKQRLELQKLRAIAAFVSKGQLEGLTTRVIDDPRFRELKEEYDKSRTNAEVEKLGEAGKEAVKRAFDRLQAWIIEVYVPELHGSIDFVENQLDMLLVERDELAKRISETQANLDKANHERADAADGGRDGGSLPEPKPARR
jgi:hypothetical protein